MIKGEKVKLAKKRTAPCDCKAGGRSLIECIRELLLDRF